MLYYIRMLLPKKFYELQLEFAKKVADLKKISLEDSLIENTFFYRNFFIPSATFDPKQPLWQKYLNSIHKDSLLDDNYSWLFNLNSYKRLFPKTYTSRAKFDYFDFTSLHVWGQFLDSSENVKEPLTENTISGFKYSQTLEDIYNLFPYKPLSVEGPIQDFYEFYNLDDKITL